jgi:hypothetical protein
MNVADRTAKFTRAEFDALPRNEHGDLTVADLEMHFCFVPKTFVELLSGDDQTRYDNFQEELRCLAAQAVAFG